MVRVGCCGRLCASRALATLLLERGGGGTRGGGILKSRINALCAVFTGSEHVHRSKSKKHISSKIGTPSNAANKWKVTSRTHLLWPNRMFPA